MRGIKEVITSQMLSLFNAVDMNRKETFYSDIIGPDAYNHIISKEHLYIAASDNFITEIIQEKIQGPTLDDPEIVEIGCGPARLLTIIGKINGIKLTGIDYDLKFIEHAQKLISGLPINVMINDLVTYQHEKPVTIFYSQGVHHHIPKGQKTFEYLSNIYNQLVTGGYYILSDEFIPKYFTDEERDINLVIWYAHIISHALQDGFKYLAQEEAKTLLDDLYEGKPKSSFKTTEQIKLVFSNVTEINRFAENKEFEKVRVLASSLIKKLKSSVQIYPSGNDTLDLSRGDYKICDYVFRKEIEEVGFTIESVKSFGPIKNIGAMCVYILKKN